jgi:hypothetical protein
MLTGAVPAPSPLLPLTTDPAAAAAGRALLQAFTDVDARVLSRAAGQSGATAQAVYVEARGGGRWAHFANCGDAQAVVAVEAGAEEEAGSGVESLFASAPPSSSSSSSTSTSPSPGRPLAMLVSEIHTANAPAEAQRVRGAGGEVFMGRVRGQLAVSRAFGDAPFKSCGVIVDPYYACVKLNRRHKFVIVGCDGVWDVLGYREAVELVWGMRDPTLMAERIVIEALRKGTQDNVSVVVVRLHEY